jgi:hypothetical protein
MELIDGVFTCAVKNSDGQCFRNKMEVQTNCSSYLHTRKFSNEDQSVGVRFA